MIHIQKFIERLQGAEARGTKDFVMSVKDAKDLHADITKLLLSLESLRQSGSNPTEEVIKVQVSGGKF